MECVPARLLRVRCRLLWATALLGTAGAGESVPSQDSREPDRSAGNFGTAIHRYAHEKTWTQRWSDVQLTRQILSQSVEGARTFLLNHQKAEGNFIYGYDIVVNHALENDNQVRQAGTLWSLATLCLERPTPATHQAAIRGLDFFFRWSRPLPSGRIAPAYPGERVIKTGTVALVCLAIIDLYRSDKLEISGPTRGFYESWLGQCLDYLQSMELENGSWGARYLLDLKERDPESSPYYDGECLLAYCRAARFLGRDDLIPKIEKIAPLLAARYTLTAWRSDPDSDDTKGFYQWGCLAFDEYHAAGWAAADVLADAALALSWWMIHEHQVLLRKGNTASAVEGLLATHRIAVRRRQQNEAKRLGSAANTALRRICTWQIGGPLHQENAFLKQQNPPRSAFGGIMTARDSGIVRIDTVQHQIHAMLAALNQLYPDSVGAPPAAHP